MNIKRKIAFLCHPYHRGGVTRWMADAAIAYAREGHEVYFVTVSPVKEFFSAKGKETLLQLLKKEDNAVKILSAEVGYDFEFGTPEYRTWIYKQLLVKLPAGTPVILADDQAVWEAATALQAVYPVVGVMHADENYYYALAGKYCEKVDVFACVSERVKAVTRSRVQGFNDAHIFTIPCGINLPAIANKEIAGGVLKLVFVGRISEYQKRAGDLLKIAAALTKKGVQYHLDIIGDGPLKPALEAEVKEHRLQQQVAFPGWLSQKEVGRYLSAADILLLTSDFEGTPIAMMEALAAGCGMVGTRVSGIEDYEHHALAADCLGVYPVGDIDAAVSKITAIAALPQQARRSKARELAEKEFSMAVCLDKYLVAMDTIEPRNATAPAIAFSAKQLLYSKAIALARYVKVRMKR